MKISGINKQTPITSRIYKSDKKNVSKPSFKGLESAEHYAVELMKIDNSEAARLFISNSKKLLPVKEIRDFIAGFLYGVKNSQGTSQNLKDTIVRQLSYNFDYFVFNKNCRNRSALHQHNIILFINAPLNIYWQIEFGFNLLCNQTKIVSNVF